MTPTASCGRRFFAGRTCTAATTSRTGPSTAELGLQGRSIWSLSGCTSAVTTRNGRVPTPSAPVAPYMDPRRANRLRHPAARLYAEYIWGYVAAIRSAPLSPADRQECYGTWRGGWPAGPSRWPVGRSAAALLKSSESAFAPEPRSPIDALVAGRERKGS